MKLKNYIYIITLVYLFIIASCTKSVDKIDTPPISDYFPTTSGKYLVYKVDTVLFKRDLSDSTVSWFVRDNYDTEFTDNLGRKSMRVFRQIRKLPTQPWVSAATYYTTPYSNGIEVVENNLRSLALELPFTNVKSWNGYRYYGENPFAAKDFVFTQEKNRFMNTWEFKYSNLFEPLTLGTKSFPSTITVNQVADSNATPFIDTIMGHRTIAKEIYAKGIGLVYRSKILQENEPITVAGPIVIIRDPLTGAVLSITTTTRREKGTRVGFNTTWTLIENN